MAVVLGIRHRSGNDLLEARRSRKVHHRWEVGLPEVLGLSKGEHWVRVAEG